MIKKFLLDILINPDTENRLVYDAEINKLKDAETGTQFNIIDDTPVIFTAENNQLKDVAPVHKNQLSSFNYAEHYNRDADFFNYFEEDDSAAGRTERKRSRETIISKIPNSATSVLDIGCGGGWIAEYCMKEKKNVVSLDISAKNPVEALKKYPGEFHAAVIADSFKLPFRENSFDVIVASEVIEHLFDPKLFIPKWVQLLKPGGKLIILTPYNEKIIYHTCVHCNNITPANAHLYSFNEKNITKFLPTAGVKIKTSSFSNKYFTKLRIYSSLRFLPFTAWHYLDSALNKIIRKPALFLIEILKD